MKKITRTLTILLAAAIAMPAAVSAQDIYDDLYYSPSKAAEKKKQQQEAKAKAEAAEYAAIYGSAAPVEDSSMPLNVDVDAYNRRYSDDRQSSVSLPEDEFSYTRRIERYHNPEVVAASGDTTLMELYYNTPSEQEINVYVINDPYSAWATPCWSPYSPFYSPFYSPYYSYWGGYWGPSWTVGWGYNPWFDFSFGWGTPWYPGWGWSWGPGAWGPRPPHPMHPATRPPLPSHGWASNSHGASRPHRPTYSAASSLARRQGGSLPSMSRPGNMGRPNSSAAGMSRPSVSGNNPAGASNNSLRGSSSSNYNTRNNSNSSYRNNSSSNSSNRNSGSSYRPSQSTGRSTGGSYGGGSSRGGGGGAGRGRR